MSSAIFSSPTHSPTGASPGSNDLILAFWVPDQANATNPDSTTGVPLGIPLHPTQLYEAFAEGLICLILIYILKRAHKDGAVIGLYLVLYGLVRFGVEFLRMHDSSNPLGGPFTLEQWISLVAVAAGAWLLVRKPSQA